MPAKKNYERLTFGQFFKKYPVSKAELARVLGVFRQQVHNWETSPLDYMIECHIASGEVRVVRPEVIAKSGIFKQLKQL